uniref:Platelet endothelial aggregation receptor 1 n=1 Tax=Buteo japonicus TaxID=224669 RepID=A0A8C0HRM3_9AVES
SFGSFTAAVKESYTKPHVVSSTEPCPRALGSPLPCLQQRIVYRTEYRQAVRTDYRRRYQCCLGYYESRDTCVPPGCQEERRGGDGVSPDSWVLSPDEHCSSLCPPDTFGMNCSGRCSCQHALACSPLDGSCLCKEGWHGPDCSMPCPAGTWGPSCNRSCECAHGAACDPQSGTCSCPPGWQGPRCLAERP